MPDTECLQSKLDEARNELDAIKADGAALYAAIKVLVETFAKKHDGDGERALEHINDALQDLMGDAGGPAWRRKVKYEDRIGAIEDADLRRSAPVVL